MKPRFFFHPLFVLAVVLLGVSHLSAQTAATPDTTPTTAAAVTTAQAVKTTQAGWVHQIFGPAMSPLWLCSIILVALVINKTRTMRRSRILTDTMMGEVGRNLGQLDIKGAIQAAESSDTLVGWAWSRGLNEFSLGFTPLTESLSGSSVVALKSLRKNLWLITTISVIAPMFGLIGTVVGMIITFSTLAETGGADKSKLAVGLSFALYKTAGGLIIAIPAIISGRYFAARISSYAEEVEDGIINLGHQYSQGLTHSSSSTREAKSPRVG